MINLYFSIDTFVNINAIIESSVQICLHDRDYSTKDEKAKKSLQAAEIEMDQSETARSARKKRRNERGDVTKGQKDRKGKSEKRKDNG